MVSVTLPLYYGGWIDLAKDGGLASCFGAQYGQVRDPEERLGAWGDYDSSPVVAAGKIGVVPHSGVVKIYRASNTLEVLARNSLDETILATPAMVENNLYVQTQSQVYAFGIDGKPVRANAGSETQTLRTSP